MKITRWLIIMLAILLPLTASAEGDDFTDLWCSEGYECIECAAFASIGDCDEYKRTHMPSLSGPPVWDLIFDELGLKRPPEFPNVDKRLSVASEMIAVGRQLKTLKALDIIR